MTEEEINSGCQYLSEQTCLSQDQFEKIVGRSPTFSSIKPVAFEMDRNDRIRACYQHCCLCYVMNQKMTNRSLRERFGLAETKAVTASQIIAATIEAGQIKLDAKNTSSSPRYNRYIPFWA